jgi:UDP-glucuronate 4-epimerase
MKTILVTGGAGFIGSHVCERLLSHGYKVINIDNFNSYYDPAIKRRNIFDVILNSNYILYEGDILDKELLKKIFESNKIDKIIHLAAMAGVRNSLSDPLKYVDVDIKGTVNLLEFAKEYNISKFVFASSSSVYGINSKVPFSEEDKVDLQVSPYAAAKRAGEIYCATYSNLYNISISCLRFFTVYGPRQRPEMAIHLFTRLIDEGKEIPVFGDGNSSRDYTYIDEIVDGIIAAAGKEYQYEIFNIGNSYTITLNKLIEVIETNLGKKANINRLPFQKGDVPKTYADITKAKERLGYNPQISIVEGIEKFINWYRKHY